MGDESPTPGEAVDPLSGSGLDAIYTSQIEPQLVTAEAARRKAMTLFGVGVFAGATAVLIEVAITQAISHGGNYMPHPGILVATVLGALFLAYWPLAAVGAQAKRDVLRALCAPLGIRYGLIPDRPDPAAFRALGLLPKADDETYDDTFGGVRAGCAFGLTEATYTRGSGKNRSMVFHGQMIRVAFPRRFLGRTVVLRDAGWLNRFECPKGMEKAGLEDPRFERAFEVFCTDQVEARTILTPDLMEKLTELETRFAGQHLRCGFADGAVMIAVESPDRYEIGNLFSTLVERSRVEGIAGDLSAVLRLIDSFVGRGVVGGGGGSIAT